MLRYCLLLVVIILLTSPNCSSYYVHSGHGKLRIKTLDGIHRASKSIPMVATSNPVFLTDLDRTIRKIGDKAFESVTSLAQFIVSPVAGNITQKNLPISVALEKIQVSMDTLDNVAGRSPQLTTLELIILISTVGVSAVSPFLFSNPVVEVLVPSMAAVSASIGISAEYAGKVAVSKGKEIAALSIQAAAEAEVILAVAERTKAILPLCVGIATTASAFTLLAPSLFKEITLKTRFEFPNELYLLFPLVAVLSAAIAGLATQESGELASRAKNLGARRFASQDDVGRSWLSASEQIERSSSKTTQKWKSFAIGVLPGPFLAALIPGPLAFKAIVCATLAAAQAAYYLTVAEYLLADAVEGVSLKARTSAVADTYANQSQRAGAILPFTSALASLCAAGSAAAVELLPLVSAIELQAVIAMVFPTGAALFAAAAAVSKARCEVDTAASFICVSKGLTGGPEKQKDPLTAVIEQVIVSAKTSVERFITRYKQIKNAVKKGTILKKIRKWFQKLFKNSNTPDTDAPKVAIA